MFFCEHACDSCTIWNYFVLFPQTCLMDQNRSHRPIVHLSIVTRAVSQCSVIINHALLFVTHQFILASPCYQQQIWNSGSSNGGIFEFGKRDLRLQLSLALLQLNVKWRSALEFAGEEFSGLELSWMPPLQTLIVKKSSKAFASSTTAVRKHFW